VIVGESGEDRGLFFLSPSTFVLATDLIANAVMLQHVVYDLVKRPKGGNFQFADFREKQHHAKMYIVEYGCGYD